MYSMASVILGGEVTAVEVEGGSYSGLQPQLAVLSQSPGSINFIFGRYRFNIHF